MKTVVSMPVGPTISVDQICLDMDSILAYKENGAVFHLVALFCDDDLAWAFHGEAADDTPSHASDSMRETVLQALEHGRDLKWFNDRKAYHKWASE